jgi:hypothetical protein
LQMLAGMSADGVDDPDLVLAALAHDIGKVLLLTGEDAANVCRKNAPLGSYPDGVGLDAVTLQWNHDEFAYSRLVDWVPPHVAWVVRYHSIWFDECARLMNAQDRVWFEQYLKPFGHYDHDTKTAFSLPSRRIDEWRDVVEEAFPKPIRF